MKTRIVPRDDVKVMPSLTALHGDKGVLGNQEIGGGLQFCIVEEVICDCGGFGCDQCGNLHGCQSGSPVEDVQGRSVGGL